MIGPEQRLMALGVPAALAREMVTLFGGGSGGTPLLAANNLSDLTNVPTARQNLGLGAFAQRDNVAVMSSATISLSGDGADNPLSGNVAVSANSGNALTAEADGLFVPTSSGGVPEAPNDGDVYGRGDLDWLKLAAVASSGSYADLSNTPTIPAAQVNSDWSASSGVAQILNKPALATVATSGSYADLSNKPTIPAAQVNSDWSASSGVAEILNKPTIPTSPGGDFVGTTATQTLTNKTLGAGTKETVDLVADLNINVNSAPFMQVELAANATAFVNLAVGVSRSIWLNPGTYTVTWPAGTVLVGDINDIPASKWSLITLTGMPSNTAGVAALVASQP